MPSNDPLPVVTAEEIYLSLLTFNENVRNHPDHSSLRSDFWVYHLQSGLFGPCKFVGFSGMTFEHYNRAEDYRSKSKRAGSEKHWKFGAKPFTKGGASKALEAVLILQFFPDKDLGKKLISWAVFGKLKAGAKSFILLDYDGSETTVAGTFIPSDHLNSGGQGYSSDAEERQALEAAAMDAAEKYYKKHKYTVERKGKPYDLHCTKAGAVLHVEVKGTKSSGDKVILTQNEVEFARSNRESMALFVLHSIKLVPGSRGLRGEGGEHRIIFPWDVDEGVLRPTQFMYQLPETS